MAKKMVFETSTNTYAATESIGDGGSGTVYRVTDDSGKAYALKLLRDVSSEARKRFKNELEFCRRNTHPRIVTVVGDGIVLDNEKKSPFYVMPLYHCSLRKLMKEGIAPESILVLFRDILDVLNPIPFLR